VERLFYLNALPLLKNRKGMKKILLLAFLALTFNSFSQTTFRFADSTAVWNQCHASFYEGPQGTWATYQTNVYRVSGDSVLYNKTYQKIIPGYPSYEAEYALIRKDSSSKVFLFDPDILSDRMIYDFGLNEDDTLRLFKPASFFEGEDTIKFVVDSTDSVTYGTLRKRMFVRCVSGNYCGWFSNDILVEGIGSLSSHLLSPYIYEFLVIPGDAFNLLYFEENGNTYNFSSGCTVGVSELSSDNIKIAPNPATSHLTLQLQQTPSVSTIFQLFDLTGRLLLQKPLTEKETRVDVSDVSKGMYLYQLTSAQQQISSGKLVVE
jgi:hypothetical protein